MADWPCGGPLLAWPWPPTKRIHFGAKILPQSSVAGRANYLDSIRVERGVGALFFSLVAARALAGRKPSDWLADSILPGAIQAKRGRLEGEGLSARTMSALGEHTPGWLADFSRQLTLAAAVAACPLVLPLVASEVSAAERLVAPLSQQWLPSDIFSSFAHGQVVLAGWPAVRGSSGAAEAALLCPCASRGVWAATAVAMAVAAATGVKAAAPRYSGRARGTLAGELLSASESRSSVAPSLARLDPIAS